MTFVDGSIATPLAFLTLFVGVPGAFVGLAWWWRR